ncbi:MAG: hypothetical protein ACK55I_09735, partial [bacterium]
ASRIDPCLVYKWSDDCLSLLGMCVDDYLFLPGGGGSEIEQMDLQLKQEFADEIELMEASEYLGIGISYAEDGESCTVSQFKYIDGLAEAMGLQMASCSRRTILHNMEKELYAETVDATDSVIEPGATRSSFPAIIGILNYLASNTRDIAYAVRILSCFTKAPRARH